MPQTRPWYTVLYTQVVIAIVLGVLVGRFFPNFGVALKPLGDSFVALVKMMIAPVILCTVVQGIGSIGDIRKVGRVGVKALVYYEIVSTLALIAGLVIAHVLHPGSGLNINAATLDAKSVSTYVSHVQDVDLVSRLQSIIPETFMDAFVRGDVLQVLLIAILSGFAISRMGSFGSKIAEVIGGAGKVFFGIIRIVVRAAPIGAFGAIAFTVGRYNVSSLASLAKLIAVFYFTSLVFVIVVLGIIAHLAGFSIFRFIAYIKDELLIVLGTSSSETVLPAMMQKLERLGPSRSIVGLVFPTGYSFNTDGTNIYMTLSVLFLAQATNTHLSLSQEISVLLFAMVATKGASGVTGTGFVTLAATLAVSL